MTLTADQQKAFEQISGSITKGEDHVLMGYAGTGKTFLCQKLVAEYSRSAFCAPTNKAAKVLRETTGKEATTIHSLLGFVLHKGKLVRRGNTVLTPDEYDVIFVDECSMLSTFLYDSLKEACRGVPIVFIGDPAQLPPVKDVAISVAFSRTQNKSMLEQIVRQAEGNPIIELAHVIRKGELAPSDLGKYLDGKHLISAPVAEDVNIANYLRDNNLGVVTGWTNKYTDGAYDKYKRRWVDGVNWKAHYAKHGMAAQDYLEGQEVVLQKPLTNPFQNNEVVANNGDYLTIGDIRSTPDDATPWPFETWDVRFANAPMQARVVKKAHIGTYNSYMRGLYEKKHFMTYWQTVEALADIKHVYASTCHKLQGSTYDFIAINPADIYKNHSAAERDKCLYVAVTRAREKVAFLV